MDIMGYQAVTVEMVQRVRKACQVHLDHVVLKEKRVRRVWQGHLAHVVLKEKRVRRVWQVHLDHVELKGEEGPVGKVAAEQRNWKQCAWKKEEHKDIGLIKVSAWEKNYKFLF